MNVRTGQGLVSGIAINQKNEIHVFYIKLHVHENEFCELTEFTACI